MGREHLWRGRTGDAFTAVSSHRCLQFNTSDVVRCEGDLNQKLRPWKKVTDQCPASTSFASDVDTQQGPDLQRILGHQIAVNQIKSSEDILQLKHKLAEYGESLE